MCPSTLFQASDYSQYQEDTTMSNKQIGTTEISAVKTSGPHISQVTK